MVRQSTCSRKTGLAIEWLLSLVVVVSVIYSAIFLWINSHLPQPFFYEPYDIYADWFNTAFWAREKGSYDVWATIYAPLSFVFLRIFGFDHCYLTGRAYDPSAGLAARDCDWLGIGSIWGFFLLDIVLIYLTFRRVDKQTAIPRTLCLGLGWPMLDGLERGNLVLVSFTCLVLAFGPILRKPLFKICMVGLAINFKVYLIAALLPLLLKRRWFFVEASLVSTVAVYAVTLGLLGRGTPQEIFNNLVSWSSLGTSQPLDMWFATTYNSLRSLLLSDDFPFVLLLGSRSVNLLLIIIPTIQHFTQSMIILAAIMAWLRPEVVPAYRVVNLGVMFALITQESGGYTPVYWSYFVLMEPWSSPGRKVAILIVYLLAPSFDYALDQALPVVRDTYFRGTTTIITFYVTLGPILRPLLIQVAAVAISCVTIAQVWQDIRRDGWANRWRFRRDVPLLPWVSRPRRPHFASA